MASLAKDGSGWRIVFTDPDGRRKTLRLGRVDKKAGESIRGHVEALLAAQTAGVPVRQETAVWLGRIGKTLRDRLVRVGLAEAQERAAAPTLGDWIRDYIERRKTVKQGTKTTWRNTERNLVTFFGESRRIDSITPADADAFREYLAAGAGLSPATVGKRLQIARQFFRAMVRARMIQENPFADVKGPAVANSGRLHFVSREDVQKILEACPSVHWRTITALARFGGLRCPSEVLSLKWEAVDWANARMRVDSPKTEHHDGGAFRIVPIFPELRPYLAEAWELAEPGAVYVIPERFRRAATRSGEWKAVNLRTTFEKIVKRAGLAPWPRLFQNLRSSRETELVERFPVHVVAAWIGNTPKVAQKHYLQITDEHFAAAAQPAQNPAQQNAAISGLAQKIPIPPSPQVSILQGFATTCNALHHPKVGDDGFEPPTSTL
ncbi:MAG: hypothetical protein Kow0040_01950 [Thermogutta sp.]